MFYAPGGEFVRKLPKACSPHEWLLGFQRGLLRNDELNVQAPHHLEKVLASS
jgi:hypothetical protein